MFDLIEITQTGGKPSNANGSKYSEICKLVEQYKTAMNGRLKASYINATAREKLFKILEAIKLFNASKHGIFTSKTDPKKSKELEAAENLRKEIVKTDLQPAMMCHLLDKYAVLGATPLIKNSMNGWIAKLKLDFNLKFAALPGVNMQVTGGTTLNVGTTKFGTYLSGNPNTTDPAMEKEMVSILVHEYHHLLTKGKLPLYYDEFVAHWKQYDAAGVRTNLVERVTLLNDWLESAYHCTHPNPAYKKIVTGLKRLVNSGVHILIMQRN